MSEELTPYGAPARARITRQGQITVPRAVRDALGARPGDDLVFVAREGEIVVRHQPRRSILAYVGAAADTAPRTPLGPEEVAAAVEDEVGQAHADVVRRSGPARGSTGRPTLERDGRV
jgi:AbrB family looped-hinge helix DNA binding protein